MAGTCNKRYELAQKKLEADVAAAASTVKSNLPESLQGTSQQGWGLSLDAANVKVQV